MSKKNNHQQLVDDQEISELRLKSEQTSMKQELKPGPLGNLSAKKVIEYINTLRAQWQQAEQTYTNHINDLTKEKEQMMLELKSMQDQINDRKKVVEERNQLHQKIIRLEEEIKGYEKYVLEAQEKVQAFESELENSVHLREDNETYQATIEQLNKKIEMLTNDVSLRDNSQKNLIEDNERLLETVQQLKELDSTKASIQLTRKIRELEKTNQALAQSNEAVTQKNDVLESNVNNLMLEQREQSYANTKLKNEVIEREEQIADLLKEKSLHEMKSIDLANQLQTIKTQVKSLQAERDYLETKLNKQQSELKQLSKGFEYMNNLEAKMQAINTTMEERIGDLRKELFKNHDRVLDEMQSMAKKTSQIMLTSAQQETAQLKESQTQYIDSLLSSFNDVYDRISPMINTIEIEDESVAIDLKMNNPVEIENGKIIKDKKTIVEFKQSFSK